MTQGLVPLVQHLTDRDTRRAVNCRTKGTGLYYMRPLSIDVGHPHASQCTKETDNHCYTNDTLEPYITVIYFMHLLQ